MSFGEMLATPLRSLQRMAEELAETIEGSGRSSGNSNVRGTRDATLCKHPAPNKPHRGYELVRNLQHGTAATRVRVAMELAVENEQSAAEPIAIVALNDRREVRQVALGALLVLDAALFVDTTLQLVKKVPRVDLLEDLAAALENAVRCAHMREHRAKNGSRSDGAY